MANWAELKQKARDSVHKTFSVFALYSDNTVRDVPINVRLHRKSAYIGEDYSDYSPGLFSQINRVIVDLREVTPKRGGKIYIPDFDEITVEIENYLKQGEHYVLCEVKA